MNELINKDSEWIIHFMGSLDRLLDSFEHLTANYRPTLGGERFFTDKEVSARLKVSRRTLQDYRNEGRIAYIQLVRQKIMGAVLQAQTGLVTKEHLELAVTKPNSPVNFALRNDTEDKERILRALKQANGNRKVAAELLGIGRTTLYSKLEEYGLKYKFQQP